MYTANSISTTPSDENQAGSVQLDARHMHSNFKQEWLYRVQIYLSDFNMATAVGEDGSGTQWAEWHAHYNVDPIYLHLDLHLLIIKELHNNHDQLLCSKDTGFILAQCMLWNVKYVYKIMFTTCASTVNKCGARHNRRVSALSLGSEFGPWSSSALTTITTTQPPALSAIRWFILALFAFLVSCMLLQVLTTRQSIMVFNNLKHCPSCVCVVPSFTVWLVKSNHLYLLAVESKHQERDYIVKLE